jgi:hypothetical protein
MAVASAANLSAKSLILLIGAPNGNRTRVSAVKGVERHRTLNMRPILPVGGGRIMPVSADQIEHREPRCRRIRRHRDDPYC